jgi:putative SOS response-associated peptidase YedK
LRPSITAWPAVVPEGDWDAWLDPQNRRTSVLQVLLAPTPAEEFEVYRVSREVAKGR